ncbi:MAG: alpha/beta fold hydrolase [Anaerolineae bacterium]
MAILLMSLDLVPLQRAVHAAPRPSAKWTTFTQANSALPGNAIAALAAGPDGRVWVGTYGRGAGYVDTNGWATFAPGLGIPGRWVTALAVGPDHEVWLGTFGAGLSHYNGESWRTFNTNNSGLTNDWVTALAVAPNGILWVGTHGGGVATYDGKRWRTFNRRNVGLASDWVTAVAAGPDGDIWVGTYRNGVSHFEPLSLGSDLPDNVLGLPIGTWRTYAAGADLPSGFINAVAAGPSGTAWIATDAGLTRFTPTLQRPFPSTGLRTGDRAQGSAGLGTGDAGTWRTFTTQDGLPSNNIRAVAVDDRGTVWAGTPHGVAWLESDSASTDSSATSEETAGHRWRTHTTEDGLVNNYVETIAVDTAGNIWLGTLGGISVLGEPMNADRVEGRLPVIFVHGWTPPLADGLQNSQFKFLARWLHRDGFPAYYATGISPDRTLYENAERLRAVINEVKEETGADQVYLIGHSMGGLNIRAYTESALYQGDVAGVFTLGSPHAGVHLWRDLLAREIMGGNDQPSTRELLPEHMALFNRTNANDHGVSYYLVAGDVTRQESLDFLDFLPANDGLISVWSAHAVGALVGSSVGLSTSTSTLRQAQDIAGLSTSRQLTTDDIHGWSENTILSDSPAYLWPQRLYLNYLRPALLHGLDTPQPAGAKPGIAPRPVSQHRTAYHAGEIDPATKREIPIPVDPARSARFVLLWRWGDLNVTLTDPLDREIQSDGQRVQRFDLETSTFANLTLISVERPMSGTWTLTLNGANLEDRARYVAYAIIDGTVTLEATDTTSWARPGSLLPVTATLKGGTSPIARAGVHAEITWPDGSSEVVLMFDDGKHGDGKPDDGIYGRMLTLSRQAGYVPIVITARDTWQGAEFERGRTIFATIASDAARLTGAVELSFGTVEDLPAGRPSVDVGVDVTRAGRFGLSVSLVDGVGEEIARSTWPVEVQKGRHMVHVPIDPALLDGKLIPFSVNRVILMDLNGAATLADEWIGGTEG